MTLDQQRDIIHKEALIGILMTELPEDCYLTGHTLAATGNLAVLDADGAYIGYIDIEKREFVDATLTENLPAKHDCDSGANVYGPEQIEGVAIKWNGIEWRLPRPSRHHDVIWMIHERMGDINIQGQEGFYTNKDRFVDRTEAATIATNAKQLKFIEKLEQLYSEDLW